MSCFSELLGKTIVSIEGLDLGSTKIIFECLDGSKYKMYYDTDNDFEDGDLGRRVFVEEIVGSVFSIRGSPIYLLDKFHNNEYRLTNTDRRSITIKWHGADVSFICSEGPKYMMHHNQEVFL